MKQTEKKPYIKASMNETELLPVTIIASSGGAAGGGEVPAGAPSSAGATTPGFNVDPNW